MRPIWTAACAGVLALGLLPGLAKESPKAGRDWPQFRGPAASGVAEGRPTPVTWDAEQGKNVLWKTNIPGLSHASPVVWGDRVFVTTAISGLADAELKVGLYGNTRARRHGPPVEGLLPGPEVGQDPLGPHGAQRRSED